MQRNGVFPKVLALGGTLLIWLPLLAPVLFAVLGYFTRGEFWFDFLLPGELFPVALAGAVLLMAAALWTQDRRALIIWSTLAAVGFLLVLVNTGGGEAGSRQEMLALALLALYTLAMAVGGVGGVLLVRDLFRQGPRSS